MPLYALSRQYGMDGDTEALADKVSTALEACADPVGRIHLAYGIIEAVLVRSNLKVELEKRIMAAVFSFDRLPMVQDPPQRDLLADRPVVATSAGDRDANRTLAEATGQGGSRRINIRAPPGNRLSGVHREVAGRASGVRGGRDAHAGCRRVSTVKIV